MEKLDECIKISSNECIAHVRELVRLKSIQGEPQPDMPFGQDVSNCLVRALQIAGELGFKTKNLDGYCGYAEYGQGGEYIGVLGHLDVVPEGDGWICPPYSAEMRGSRIYGRGTMDDKGPVVAALYGLKAIKDAGLPLTHRVRIIFGTNEESGCGDMPYYTLHEPAPLYGFTPDGEFPIIYSEKGLLFAEIEKNIRQQAIKYLEGGTAPNIVPANCRALLGLDFSYISQQLDVFIQETGFKLSCEEAEDGVLVISEGAAAHGSKPHLGKNAIMQMLSFIAGLPIEGEDMGFIRYLVKNIGMETDGATLGLALKDEAGELTLNVGLINIRGNSAKITLDIRYPGAYAEKDILDILEDSLRPLRANIKKRIGMPSVYFPKDHFLIRTLMDVYERQTGKYEAPLAIGGGTYAKSIINTVAFGPILPGRADLNHMANEYIDVDELVFLTKIYGNAIYELAK